MRKNVITSSRLSRRKDAPKLVNLTGHTVRYVTSDKRIVELPSEGRVRVSVESMPVPGAGEEHNMAVQAASRVRFHGLPRPVPGTLLIVSNITLRAIQGARMDRDDILSPATASNDNPITCHRGVYAVQRFNTISSSIR